MFSPTLKRQMLGYVLCGGTATIADVGVFYLLATYAGMHYLYANIVAYGVGMVVNFALNKRYTFSNTSTRVPLQFFVFSLVAFVGLLLNQAVLYVLVEYVHLAPLYAKLFAVGAVLCWNFYGHRRFTFGLVK